VTSTENSTGPQAISSGIPLYQVDAFTDRPFGGNPAAVALETEGRDDAWLQAVALEMNLSETAFPTLRDDGDWDLRWFTPVAEVDLCGHATLGTAHLLFEQRLVKGDTVRFHTRSGLLTCRRVDDGDQAGAIVMDFPASPATPCEPFDGLEAALGVEIVNQAMAFDALVEVADPKAVAAIEPDLAEVAKVEARAVIVTAPGDIDDGPAHFVSRVFGPRVGIAEDPVTGSAHCISGPWWGERLGLTEMSAHQVSPRGGRLDIKLVDDRVELTGRAITVLVGNLNVDRGPQA
jgi:PhzF family phenazine biosynthesis protein